MLTELDRLRQWLGCGKKPHWYILRTSTQMRDGGVAVLRFKTEDCRYLPLTFSEEFQKFPKRTADHLAYSTQVQPICKRVRLWICTRRPEM